MSHDLNDEGVPGAARGSGAGAAPPPVSDLLPAHQVGGLKDQGPSQAGAQGSGRPPFPRPIRRQVHRVYSQRAAQVQVQRSVSERTR